MKIIEGSHMRLAGTLALPIRLAGTLALPIRLAGTLALPAVALAFALAPSAYAAGFWKGTGQDSGNADNWSNSQAFMGGDNFYIRDTRMTDTAHRRDMTLTASPNDTTGHLLFFQCGTEDDPFVVDGNAISFANGASITIALGSRNVRSGTKLISWTDAPSDTPTFLDGETGRKMLVKEDGVYPTPNGIMIIFK